MDDKKIFRFAGLIFLVTGGILLLTSEDSSAGIIFMALSITLLSQSK